MLLAMATVGEYRLGAAAVSDPLGVVYQAQDEVSGRPMLIRFLLPLAEDEAGLRRFRIEMPAIARLRHANLLPVEDWGETDGVPYVGVAQPDATPLSDLLATGRVDRRTAMTVLRDVAAALDHAHLSGVVHGDVEPATVLVAPNGRALLSELGLALLVNASPVPGSGRVQFGSPDYAAPERAAAGAVEPAADVYALAAMAYELLTGSPPFSSPTAGATLQAHLYAEPPPPSSRNATLPAGVDAVLLKGLAKHPHARWQTAGAMVHALGVALTGAPVEAPQPPALPLWLQPKWVALVAAGATLLLLAGIILGMRAGRDAPTMSLSTSSAAIGDQVVVTGRNLPPGQPGTLTIQGRAFPVGQFRADDKGGFAVSFVVPPDLGGDRSVQACWGSGCPLSRILHVAGPAAQPSAPPAATPTPSPSALLSPVISLSDETVRRGDTIVVTGRGFDPTQRFDIVLRLGNRRVTLQPPTSPDRSGAFSIEVEIPTEIKRGAGQIVACVRVAHGDQPGACAEQGVLIT